MIGVNRKVDRLLEAMAEHEGWYPAGTPGYPNGSMSYRNHNPGNLRSSIYQVGTVNNFAVFKNDWIGWIAFQHDIMQKARGNTSTGLGPKSTISDLIYKWAPPSDNNNTEAYIKSVEAKSGLSRTMTLGELFK
jgi:hypothetical protein